MSQAANVKKMLDHVTDAEMGDWASESEDENLVES